MASGVRPCVQRGSSCSDVASTVDFIHFAPAAYKSSVVMYMLPVLNFELLTELGGLCIQAGLCHCLHTGYSCGGKPALLVLEQSDAYCVTSHLPFRPTLHYVHEPSCAQANAIDLDSGDDEPSMVSQANRPTQSQSRLNLGGRRLPASLSQPGASQSKARLVRR